MDGLVRLLVAFPNSILILFMEEETYLQDAKASCTEDELEAMAQHSRRIGLYETWIDPSMARDSNDDDNDVL